MLEGACYRVRALRICVGAFGALELVRFAAKTNPPWLE